MGKLTEEEKLEFKQLKRDLLEYHHFNCTHYNPKKVRYNELWDKNAKGTLEALNKVSEIGKKMDLN